MGKLLIVQTKISADKLEELKLKTGKDTIKEALSEAVYHYLYCPLASRIDESIERCKRGRKPLYLKNVSESHASDQR